ncbi:hypothetical protein [Ruegeria arenilitoris]|uniref:hypothetical protein n=1 Tax=Ruegeria arenilitoris TaxID=1173585 RepID=UPI00147AAEFF|nr:hypothetical protein [Ruegeria arenilitoris]
MTDRTEFDLCVELSADEWAQHQRRLAFSEAVLAQVLRDKNRIREWFTAREIAALDLPALPNTPAGVGQIAHRQNWRYITVARAGRPTRVYHYTSFPNSAFAAFIGRIVDVPKYEHLVPEYVPPKHAQPTTEPQWVLPLMRVIKTQNPRSWQAAKRALQSALPGDSSMPTDHDLKAAYQRLSRS